MVNSPIAAWRQTKTHYKIPPNGTVTSYTQVTTPPVDFKKMAPYCIAFIALDDGTNIVAQLTDIIFEQIYIGMRVCGVLRKIFAHDTGIIYYGIKFTKI